MGKVSLLEWLVQGYLENSFGEAIHLILINSSLEMLRNLFLSFPKGNRGGRRSTVDELCRSSFESDCRSAAGSWCRSMSDFLKQKGLGG
ncbi:hypothetical protein F2Q69_00006843 [Brassica cretica]|uniref:Uncharacterized protein n=1 Tax=Brassica cretica TaxID=69181 RepID=A0A8S9P3P7_BRACR|nr:hypothetical protein F2Q69_00006843 [Brassica cretica]